MKQMKPIHILLIEDNEGDILLTKEALEEKKIANKLSIVKNGRDGVDFMLKRGKFQEAETPDLVLLDINLPLKSGHEVLKEIKENSATKQVPVIILTTSSSESDITESYRNYANCFITKPVDVDDFLSAIGMIEDFWLSIVMLPKNK
jgi:CheY-like chemotaxis protein